MSLVAYDSSDESSEDEVGKSEVVETAPEETVLERTSTKLSLPTPKYNETPTDIQRSNAESNDAKGSPEKIHFEKLPKPKNLSTDTTNFVEDDDVPPKREDEFQPEKPAKRDRAPVRITVPSLSEFKDLDEENEKRRNRIAPSKTGTGLFALLPPPKGMEMKSTGALIPQAVSKARTNPPKLQTVRKEQKSTSLSKTTNSGNRKSLGLSNYDSNSEDEDEASGNSSNRSSMDFFALTSTETESNPHVPKLSTEDLLKSVSNVEPASKDANGEEKESYSGSGKMLVSNVMNLPREEILLKNKAEVGPKLPVPEQEYNIDTEGNVAFDEKAIEYLCGKRGIKRKNKEIDEANIIEINGEDIKPDEREWLVKALTEEPIERPVSMQGGGVNSQSKKKHQITYLAHQAKAMEMELKNQWAQNKMTRKQTQSKYGF